MNEQYYFSYEIANPFKYHCLRRYWRLELPRLLKILEMVFSQTSMINENNVVLSSPTSYSC